MASARKSDGINMGRERGRNGDGERVQEVRELTRKVMACSGGAEEV
jgi:hypothetical protein